MFRIFLGRIIQEEIYEAKQQSTTFIGRDSAPHGGGGSWAYENGITQGTGGGRFDPGGTVTRAQTVTFLFRTLHGEAAGENTFTDVRPGAYYYEPVRWAVDAGITMGTGNGKFSPNDACLRAQIVTFLFRAYSHAS